MGRKLSQAAQALLSKDHKEKNKRGVCGAKNCSRKTMGKSWSCAKHNHIVNKINQPISYAYNTLRSNAKRRGHEFGLSKQEFKDFTEKSGYLDEKGKSSDSLSIDRIDSTRGYFIDNIQIMKFGLNSQKRQRIAEEWVQDKIEQWHQDNEAPYSELNSSLNSSSESDEEDTIDYSEEVPF